MIPNQVQPLGSAVAGRTAARSRLAVDIALLAGALVLFSLIAFRMAPFVPDDSFISYRYAANLAGGSGLRFNPTDSPVEGYSNFLWILLLAAAARLGVTLEAAGVILGAVCGALAIGLLWAILRRRGRTSWHLALPVVLMALAAPLVLYSVSGMETALFALLLPAVVLAVDWLLGKPTAGRGLLLAVVASLAALTRPEGILAFPVVAACLVAFEWRSAAERRRAIWRSVGVAVVAFVVLQAAYHVWRISYFDAVWPTPFLSKGTAGSVVEPWLTNIRQFFVRQTHYYAPMAYYYAALALPAVIGVGLAWRRRGERYPVEWTSLALAAVFAAVYVNFVDWMPGMRYYAPLIGLVLVPFGLLGAELRGRDRSAQGGDFAYLLLGATLALFSLSTLATLRLDSQQLQGSTQASMVELGLWLRRTMPAETVLAMSDVGAAPYFSGLRTVDINPESLTDRHIAENGWSADYFFAVDPDVVAITAFSLTEPDFYSVHEELYAMPRFQSTYERIGIIRNDWFQDRSYWVFARRGMTPDASQMATFPVGIHKP